MTGGDATSYGQLRLQCLDDYGRMFAIWTAFSITGSSAGETQ